MHSAGGSPCAGESACALEVENAVLAAYAQLPKRGKPLVRSNGVKEWTVLAGVVLGSPATGFECVALATGVKSTPETHFNAGKVLHDCHAEILALRAFNLYLIKKCTNLNDLPPVYLYICAPPCGDASMSLLNGAPSWTTETTVEPSGMLRGRAHFNLVGRVRTKPGRQDSQLTMSKSCSDKLCWRQNKGLLLAPARQIFVGKNVFIDTLVCPIVEPDFTRCFNRFDPVHKFKCVNLVPQFKDYHPDEGAPSPCSIVWTKDVGCEIIANGLKQGSRQPSMVSRYGLLEACHERDPDIFANVSTYNDMKRRNEYPESWIRTASDNFPISPNESS